MAFQPEKLELRSKSPFISPYIMNNSPLNCLVGKDGRTLIFENDGRDAGYELDAALEVGCKVQIRVGRYGVDGVLLEEQVKYEDKLKEERELRQRERLEAEKKRLEEWQRDVKEFNEGLNIPFKWVIDHKTVMSGLQENSWGNGMNNRSVWHIRVLEPFKDGRLSRDIGDFLCGKDHSKHQGYTAPHESDNSNHKITCKACLKIAERFKARQVS